MTTYKTHGTCCRAIEYDVQDGIVTECRFVGGCMGNTQGVAALVKGMKVEDAIARLKGIQCGFRGTSCPDQLACALEATLNA
ncbi:MAG: TIGR03905 family TSCPD domain-containing protein [Clostridia bacterium]|nr:TIGR03905 family TSCPD domain-containing protein [Clostridia bacterium]